MRRLIDFLPSNNTDGVPEWPSFDDIERVDMSLDTLIPDNPNKPYDMKELIQKVVDEGDFFEISETFAKNIVTGFGRIAGRTVASSPTSRWCWPACSTPTRHARPRALSVSVMPSTSRS
jgi:acetyl-CoA carboxylase carboxyltransferase component